MAYIDGFVLPVPTKKLSEYLRMARRAGKIWREHGALEFRECVQEDAPRTKMAPFKNTVKANKNEVVLFSYIVFKSRAHRDTVNAKVMKDPRIASLCHEDKMPFDPKRMAYGGFTVRVDA